MRIFFMGTPDFAEVSLRAVAAAGHEICGVFTQPDKPAKRGMKLTECPVKQAAKELGIPVWQPVKLRDGTAEALLRDLAPELVVVVAYGRLLPRAILDVPKYGTINIHGSLLPKYRGAAPVQWAVLNQEPVTGVSAMYLAEEMDAGDVIDTRETGILPGETAGELYHRLAQVGAALLVSVVGQIEDGTATRTPQDAEKVTFAPMLTREMSPVDWQKDRKTIVGQILGLDPWPGATAEFSGVSFKLFRAESGAVGTDEAPGTVVSAGKGGLEVACGDGTVLIRELQAPGGKRMPAADYLRGHPIL